MVKIFLLRVVCTQFCGFNIQVIFDFRFLALLAVGGSLAGSVLCFLNVSSSKLNPFSWENLKTWSFSFRKTL